MNLIPLLFIHATKGKLLEVPKLKMDQFLISILIIKVSQIIKDKKFYLEVNNYKMKIQQVFQKCWRKVFRNYIVSPLIKKVLIQVGIDNHIPIIHQIIQFQKKKLKKLHQFKQLLGLIKKQNIQKINIYQKVEKTVMKVNFRKQQLKNINKNTIIYLKNTITFFNNYKI
ncbi:hypothetical protein IMG5_021680 [Ichthyophthirius multifiliis]|uniref:Uncharacterized protein n=1 Tax=Ichthyophthirius multifiliis TaxID=5932 RepID=G0QKT3_ICHMU|nr:hypothetical protein IMG5_021680 [Ichthyophthirius multifiliis]EGR34168.1 hypothetical protein IMG5_021680 [Ichthyophthirius multifiliis]|eukprot:XP_004039472.1 hypothetical protein IMG5_021680 [Ichthyophthirius multifiliis]